MKVLINGVDYAGWLDGVRPLKVERRLNVPSLCRLVVSVPAEGTVAAPMRNQSLQVEGDDGTVYFTGYLAMSPMAEYGGLGLRGPVYRWDLEAVSDEVLLDTQLLPPSAGSSGATAAQLMEGLMTRTGLVPGSAGALETSGVTLGTVVGHFSPQPGKRWSALAGEVASQARAAYRAQRGILTLNPVGSVVHALNEADGSLQLGNLQLSGSGLRGLANDVTVCGAEEPAAYVTESFQGDGTTLVFPLAETPFHGPVAGERVIEDLFQGPTIDWRRWGNTGNEVYFGINADGLQMNGGTGVEGEASLVWVDPVEAGGTLLLEAVGVSLGLGSSGTVAGLYAGTVLLADCVAGFAVTAAMGTGTVSLAPLVKGVVAGPSYALHGNHTYTLRLRVHCTEVERVTQVYRTTGDAGLVAYGGGGPAAAATVVMEIEEFVNGVGGMPVVLYDGGIGSVPGSYLVAAASSVNLIGSIRSLFLKGQGTGWVTSTPAGGGSRTRRVGSLADGGECQLTRAGNGGGTLTFYTGLAPGAGEMITVQYRSTGRAVGRSVNATSQAALAAAGMPATAVWTGTVTEPAARSSLDCRNAAKALVTAAASVSAAWSGRYRTSNVALAQGTAKIADVWPGDALVLNAPSLPVSGAATTGGLMNAQVVVRQVSLSYTASVPDLVAYDIDFSNDWANDLSIKTSGSVPADAWLPAAVSPTYLANLSALAIVAISRTAVSVQANVTPPAGGGFEVRRRDFAFQPGQDADLVLRSSVPNFDIPRAAQAERFYVRMYDGAVPPNYSEFSAGVFVNLPV